MAAQDGQPPPPVPQLAPRSSTAASSYSATSAEDESSYYYSDESDGGGFSDGDHRASVLGYELQAQLSEAQALFGEQNIRIVGSRHQDAFIASATMARCYMDFPMDVLQLPPDLSSVWGFDASATISIAFNLSRHKWTSGRFASGFDLDFVCYQGAEPPDKKTQLREKQRSIAAEAAAKKARKPTYAEGDRVIFLRPGKPPAVTGEYGTIVSVHDDVKPTKNTLNLDSGGALEKRVMKYSLRRAPPKQKAAPKAAPFRLAKQVERITEAFMRANGTYPKAKR